jgi:long-chain acyl-CoA synthetase
LAAHSIPSFTLSTPGLLAQFMSSHHPSVIVTQADMLPLILEFIYEEAAQHHHTVIVVGEPSQQVLSTVASSVNVINWFDVEREGNRVEKIMSPVPSKLLVVSFQACT